MANNLTNSQKDHQIMKTKQQVIHLKDTMPISRPLMVTQTQYQSTVSSNSVGGRMLSNVVSEESKILKQIQATHSHDARGVDTAPIVTVVEDILQRATLPTTPTSPSEGTKELVADTLEEKLGAVAAGPKGTMLEAVAVDIQKICCEGKTVLFFISDLDLSEEELAILDKIYKESKRKDKEFPYEIVWIPLVDQMTKENEQKFKELQYKMSWYTLLHPSLLDAVSKRFIREYLGFAKKQIIVGIDAVGKETTRDAYHLILIWGNSAFPFTKERVEELWKKETWKPDFLLASIIPEFSKWAAQPNTHVCFFGGEDIEWIRKFTTTMKEKSTKAGTKIELVYIGKPNAKKAVERIIKIITAEKIAHTLPNVTSVTYFWTRIESMLYTRMQYSHNNVDNDNIIKQVMSVLSFGSGHEGWASIGKPGTTEIIQANGNQIIASISKAEFEEHKREHGFVGSICKIIPSIPGHHTGFHCNRVEFPSVAGAGVPTKVVCTDCQRPMEKYILYKCCTG